MLAPNVLVRDARLSCFVLLVGEALLVWRGHRPRSVSVRVVVLVIRCSLLEAPQHALQCGIRRWAAPVEEGVILGPSRAHLGVVSQCM